MRPTSRFLLLAVLLALAGCARQAAAPSSAEAVREEMHWIPVLEDDGEAEQLLARAGREIAPKLLNSYAAAVWEDQDECLEVRPEDVQL